MSKTRFTPWIVLACIGTLAGCTSGEGGTAGNTELNVVIPSGSSQSGPGAPESFDIEVVEYTIACNDGIDFDPTTNPDIDSGPTLDQDVTISGALEVLDTTSGEAYVGQIFLDLPPTVGCTVQLRARDAGGEVICTSTETFDIAADGTTLVNVLMFCGISYQAPVGMLDLAGDFSFNVANYCPDLFVLNCVDPDLEELLVVPGLGAFVYSGCQVRFRDADSQCGKSCDPQSCPTTPEGLDCTPGPDPGAPTTTVTCDSPGFFCAIPDPRLFGTPCTPTPGDLCFDASGGLACAPAALQNCGGGTADPECVFKGLPLKTSGGSGIVGDVGGKPPAPLNVGPGGFLVGCTVADDDGNPLTAPVPLAPGATVTCTAVTTDGDVDCDKTKTVEVQCPGLSPCQAAPPGFCDDGNDCTADSCDDSTGVAVCSSSAVADGTVCTSAPAPASCLAGVCVSSDCNAQPDPDGSCDDGNECTTNTCDAPPATTCSAAPNTGTACAGNTGVCDAGGACVDNCVGVDPDDGNPCTDDSTDSSGGTCTIINTPNDANACGTCGPGPCICSGGACISGCTVPAPVNAVGIPMACRNSFDIKAVSTFPIDLTNISTGGDCIEAGQAVNFDIDPTIALDTAFLNAAAETLCGLGTALTQADVTLAQVAVDAIAGATCTEQLSELPGTPITVILDATITGTCGAGGTVTIDSPVSLPLPAVNLPCTAGAVGTDSLQICSTGVVPLAANIDLSTVPTQTFVGVSVGGGSIQVVFQCNTSSTTSPAPGVTIGCNAPNPAGQCAALPPGDVGETPFPVSNCDFTGGPPVPPQDCGSGPGSCFGTCTTVGVGVDPATVCATFDVE